MQFYMTKTADNDIIKKKAKIDHMFKICLKK